MNPTVRVLTRSDVARLLSLAECIGAVEEVFRAQAQGEVSDPGLLGIHVPGGGFHIKAAAAGRYFVTKVNANFPGNPAAHGLPTVQGIIALYDADRGIPLALMDSIEITGQRTAAASAVAAKYLARPDARTATIVGCGVQGAYQLEAINLVRPLARAYAVDSDPERVSRLVREMSPRLGIEVVASALEPALESSDVIVTCTPSRRAFISRPMIRRGSFLAAVGADHPEKQELEPEVMASSTVVVDHLAQCLTIGDLHHAVAAGALRAADVYGTLGEVIAGIKPGRRSPEEIIVFDSTGTALQDVAAAAVVYQRAVRDGVGVPVTLAT